MAWPIGLCPASFSGFVHPSWASLLAAPHLGCPPYPCLLQDHLSEGVSSGPEEVLGGNDLANLGIRNRTSPSAPTTQVKCLWACCRMCLHVLCALHMFTCVWDVGQTHK